MALINPDGKAVAGTLSADRRSWISTEPRGYGSTYTWNGTAAGPDAIVVPVGIAAPVILQFDDHVAVLMTNPAYDYFNVPMYWAVRVSNNGEFIHANPESTGGQGSTNVTHGCVNLSTAHAKQYFETAIFGDPVEVTNSPTPLSAADGDIYDWTVPWDARKAMSALHS